MTFKEEFEQKLPEDISFSLTEEQKDEIVSIAGNILQSCIVDLEYIDELLSELEDTIHGEISDRITVARIKLNKHL